MVPGSEEDAGATRVRPAVPKFVLRGVSGAVFGKVYPVAGPVVIGAGHNGLVAAAMLAATSSGAWSPRPT